MQKVTIVIEGGQLGALLALALSGAAGLVYDDRQYVTRRDGCSQVWAYTRIEDKSARKRWVSKCKATGLTVVPAPWERKP